MTPAVPRFFYTLLPTPIGTCGLVWKGERISGVLLPEPSEAELVRRVTSRFPEAEAAEPSPLIATAIAAIVRSLEGEPTDLSFIPLDLDAVADFERRVCTAALAIPFGETRTYGELAAAVGSPGAARAVGAALGRNPFPIIVPCHRILAAGGRSGGFSAAGGTTTKFRILRIEKARRSSDAELFDSLPLALPPGR